MNKISLTYLLFISLLCFSCSGEDVRGKIVIKYTGDWTATITENHTETDAGGSGDMEFEYINPEILKATAAKTDDTDSRLVLYIYEDERIVSAASTREPEGSVSAEYDFPY